MRERERERKRERGRENTKKTRPVLDHLIERSILILTGLSL